MSNTRQNITDIEKAISEIVMDGAEGSSPMLQDRLLRFIAPEAISDGLELVGYGVEEELSLLVGIARHSEKDAARVAAIKMIRNIFVDALRLSGRLASTTARASRGEDGSLQVESMEMKTVVANMKSTEMILRGHQRTELPKEKQDERHSSPRNHPAEDRDEGESEPQPLPEDCESDSEGRPGTSTEDTGPVRGGLAPGSIGGV
jgi:hypothetical protein